jgi:TatA/E family protein of Tat protein translocase
MEIVFIMVLALLIFGPRRLPEVGRTVGKALGEFRRATNDLKRSVNAELALEEERPLPRRPGPPPTSAGAAAAGAAAPSLRPAAATHPRAPEGGAAGGSTVGEEAAAAGPEADADASSGEPVAAPADSAPAAGTKAAD